MKFYHFHLMPWRYLPADFAEKNDSAWVWCPNTYYDPAKGHDLYNEYVDALVRCEDYGFDGICVNEHHQNAYGNMPSPNLIAAMLIARTKRVKIAVIGNALPLYGTPLRIAEEYAMLDVISGGRLIAGFVVGGSPEYHSFNINPTTARARFSEAHDLIIQAWTRPGPFEFYGRYYQHRYVNPWPLPLQKPHPRVWIPGVGSLETMEFCARRRYAYMSIPFFSFRTVKRMGELFREQCEKQGYTAHPEQTSLNMGVYVAPTDAEAWERFERHFWYLQKNLLKGIIDINTPGYTSIKSTMSQLEHIGEFVISCSTRADLERGDFVVVGSPETVRQKLSGMLRELGTGNLLMSCHYGDMDIRTYDDSMRLFVSDVLPKLRAEFAHQDALPYPAAKPVFDTAEAAA
jgi:alkanesulfonate monooxygenase SsuD/methylene tetrahydromethanopterin reductase-like flavin-dependent oxidoreductase (luciferase family)